MTLRTGDGAQTYAAVPADDGGVVGARVLQLHLVHFARIGDRLLVVVVVFYRVGT